MTNNCPNDGCKLDKAHCRCSGHVSRSIIQDERIAELERCEEGAKEAFGHIVEEKKDLQAKLKKLDGHYQSSITQIRKQFKEIQKLKEIQSDGVL